MASAALPRTFPGLTGPVASLGFAPRSQWRDRAGLSPASLLGRRRVPPASATPRLDIRLGRILTKAAHGGLALGCLLHLHFGGRPHALAARSLSHSGVGVVARGVHRVFA